MNPGLTLVSIREGGWTKSASRTTLEPMGETKTFVGIFGGAIIPGFLR